MVEVRKTSEMVDFFEALSIGWGCTRPEAKERYYSMTVSGQKTVKDEPVYKHKKRGTSYTIVGDARVQCETPLQDDETVYVYRDVKDGTMSVRRPSEFHDGRFEELT